MSIATAVNCVLFAARFGITEQGAISMNIQNDNCSRSTDRGHETDGAKSKESRQRFRSPL